MTDNFDELDQRLAGLASDLDPVRLPGAAAARHRAAQRTRNQVTSALLGGVAAVAIGVVAINQDTFTATPDPAPPPTTSDPTPSEPTPSEPTAADGELREALMRVDDIAGGGGWTETAEQGGPVECGPGPILDSVSALQGHERVDFAGPENARVSQDLVRVVSDDAAGLLTALRDEVLGCLPGRGAGELPQLVDDLALLDAGDEGWMARYYMDPNDPEATTVVVGLVRFRDVLSVTVATHRTAASTAAVDHETPAAAAERMCQVLFDTDCVGEPSVVGRTGTAPGSGETGDPDPSGDPEQPEQSGQPAEPDPSEDPDPPERPELLVLADDPYLTSGDVNPVGGYGGFAGLQDSQIAPEQLESMCLDRFIRPDADVVRTGMAFSEENEGSITQLAQQMPSIDTAMRVITDHTILPDQCGSVVDTHEQTVHEPAVIDVDGAGEALVWTIDTVPLPEDPGSDPSFTGVGIARRDNVVVAVAFRAFGDPTDGAWSDYAARTLALALDRAVQ